MATGLPTSLSHIKDRQKSLKFNEDGTFRILHLTDIHEVDPEMDDDENHQIPVDASAETMNVIEKCLESTQPDLVVFGGDNISGYWDEFTYDYMAKTIRKIVEPVARRNIPLAIVFGNHDSEGEEKRPFLHRENQIIVYAEYDNFRGSMNDEDVFGCGNYNLPILSSDGSHVAWNIWCMDSNDYIRDERHLVVKGAGYGYIHDDQIAWYEKKSAELKAENGGKIVPSLLFQHIPVLQEYDLLQAADEDSDGAVETDDKTFAVAKENAFQCGVMREAPSPPREHGEQFESWKKTGDIVAAIFGHDHVNTFIAELDGIKLIQTVGAGYHTYGRERGGRLIILDEKDSKNFQTETLTVDRITDSDL